MAGVGGTQAGASTGDGSSGARDGQPPGRLGRVAASRPAARELGRLGEDVAVEYLTGRGVVVLSRNWRCREGELDIVATDRERLIVCEVKTRSGDGCGSAAESVTGVKTERIRRLTQHWLQRYRMYWVEVRFDVIAVQWIRPGLVTVQHLEGAF